MAVLFGVTVAARVQPAGEGGGMEAAAAGGVEEAAAAELEGARGCEIM